MLTKNNFTEEHIRNLQTESRRAALQVLVPSVECILGDKLTAFAPHTIGVPLHANKDMEIIKQFYDVLTLIDVVEDYSFARDTYYRLALNEIAYRGIDITPEDALMDTFMTAAKYFV